MVFLLLTGYSFMCLITGGDHLVCVQKYKFFPIGKMHLATVTYYFF